MATLTLSRAWRTRSMSRSSSASHTASFSPKVIGSACTPWVRPIIGVHLCSRARSRIASASAFALSSIRSQDSRSIMHVAVSSMS